MVIIYKNSQNPYFTLKYRHFWCIVFKQSDVLIHYPFNAVAEYVTYFDDMLTIDGAFLWIKSLLKLFTEHRVRIKFVFFH